MSIENVKSYRKLLVIYLALTFGLCWGISLLYLISYNTMSNIFGELTLQNPVVVAVLNSPGIIGLIIYFIYGKWDALLKYLKTLIPRKKDLKWIPIIFVVMSLFLLCIRLVCILVGVKVPKFSYSPGQVIIIFLKNFFGETGMIGQAFGWFGFLLPYLQGKFKNNIKAGLLTGFVFSLFLMPGYVFSSFEAATAYPFYVVQNMILAVFVSYILNDTGCNVCFFLLTFWIAATGSKLDLYYFIPSVQIIQIILLSIMTIAIHFYFKKKNADTPVENTLQVFPDFIESRARLTR
jgi:hypothetical protein